MRACPKCQGLDIAAGHKAVGAGAHILFAQCYGCGLIKQQMVMMNG